MTVKFMLIHGYNDTAAIWDPLIECAEEWAVLSQSACLHTVQLKKLADTKQAESTQILEGFCEQVEQSMQTQSMQSAGPWILVGHSMGGAIAELVAERGKVPIAGLVLLTPAPLAGVSLDATVMARFQAGYRQPDIQRARASRAAMSVNLSQQNIEMLAHTSAGLDPDLVHQQLMAWTGGHPHGAAPSTITCDVTIVTTEDQFFKRDMLEKMASRFGKASTTHIPGAGHWVHMEQPRAVAQVLAVQTGKQSPGN